MLQMVDFQYHPLRKPWPGEGANRRPAGSHIPLARRSWTSLQEAMIRHCSRCLFILLCVVCIFWGCSWIHLEQVLQDNVWSQVVGLMDFWQADIVGSVCNWALRESSPSAPGNVIFWCIHSGLCHYVGRWHQQDRYWPVCPGRWSSAAPSLSSNCCCWKQSCCTNCRWAAKKLGSNWTIPALWSFIAADPSSTELDLQQVMVPTSKWHNPAGCQQLTTAWSCITYCRVQLQDQTVPWNSWSVPSSIPNSELNVCSSGWICCHSGSAAVSILPD